MIGGMRGALLTTGVFAVLLFVLFVLLSGASVVADLVKTLIVAAVFGLYQVWMVRRSRSAPTED